MNAHLKVNRRVSKSSGRERTKKERPPTLRERLLFVVWLAGREVGTDGSGDFAQAIGKDPTQLSRWVKERERPSWDSIKRLADAVGIDAVWLDEPTRSGAVEPPDFPRWYASRLKREAERPAAAGEA
jgi:transcriptional regulator with XRE-family HTH domain